MTVGDGERQEPDYEALPGLLAAENAEARLGAAITLAAHADALPARVVAAAAPALAAVAANRSDELPQTRAQALCALANLCGAADARAAAVCAALAAAAARVCAALAADVRAGVLGERTCAWPGCARGAGAAQQRCSQCRTAWYCSAACARLHWRAGHRVLCRLVAARGRVHAASVPHADEGTLAYLAAAVLANATRSPALVAAAPAAPALARLAAVCADVAARAPLPAAARTVPLLLSTLANSAQCPACRAALTAEAPEPEAPAKAKAPAESALARVVARYLAPRVGDACALPVATLLRNLCLDKTLHARLVPSMAREGEGKGEGECAVDAPVALLGVLRGEAVLDAGEMRAMPAALRAPRPLAAGAAVREAVLEALLCLACDRPARADLITRRAYPVLREYDRAEPAERARDLVQQIVDLLARDSRGDDTCPVAEPLPLDTSAVRDDHDVTRDELQNKGARTRGEIEKSPLPPAVHMATPPPPSAEGGQDAGEDDDDEDAADDSFVEEI